MTNSVYLPPGRILPPHDRLTVFLAGAIDMGRARTWQQEVVDFFGDEELISFFNPRRDDWDSSWTQELTNPQFTEQVNWELDMIERSDLVLIFFPKDSQAPISLLEFGYIAARAPGKLIVVVEPGYWRRGNLEVICNRERIALYDTLAEGKYALEDALRAHSKHL